jgi:hypothetical protein
MPPAVPVIIQQSISNQQQQQQQQQQQSKQSTPTPTPKLNPKPTSSNRDNISSNKKESMTNAYTLSDPSLDLSDENLLQVMKKGTKVCLFSSFVLSQLPLRFFKLFNNFEFAYSFSSFTFFSIFIKGESLLCS